MYVVLRVGARAVPSIGAVSFFSLPQVGSSPFLTARLRSRSEAGSETGVAPSKDRCQASITTGSKCSTWPSREIQTFASRAAWGWWARRLPLRPRRRPLRLRPLSVLSPTPRPLSWRPPRPPAAPPRPPAAGSSRPRPETPSRSGAFFVLTCGVVLLWIFFQIFVRVFLHSLRFGVYLFLNVFFLALFLTLDILSGRDFQEFTFIEVLAVLRSDLFS